MNKMILVFHIGWEKLTEDVLTKRAFASYSLQEQIHPMFMLKYLQHSDKEDLETFVRQSGHSQLVYHSYQTNLNLFMNVSWVQNLLQHISNF